MVFSQPADSRIATSVSSPPRPSTQAPASSFTSRLPVPRNRCQVALANKENEQLPTVSSTAATLSAASKPASTQTARSQRQPLSTLPASESNVAAVSRATAAVTTAPIASDAVEAVLEVAEPSRPSPRTRRQWVKSIDMLPAIIPAILQYSPNSATSDGSTSSDDTINTPDRRDVRQPHFDPTLTGSPMCDVRATTIATLQACISDMQAQHAAVVAEKDARIQSVADELVQCRAETVRLQQQLVERGAEVVAVQSQLVESEAKWRTAHLRLSDSKQREGEMKELRRQLAAVSMELSRVTQRQVTAAGEQSEGPSTGTMEVLRLPVLVGDCIKRQRKAAVVG